MKGVKRTHVLSGVLRLAAAQGRWAAPLQAGVGEAVGGDVGGEAVVREGHEGVELHAVVRVRGRVRVMPAAATGSCSRPLPRGCAAA